MKIFKLIIIFLLFFIISCAGGGSEGTGVVTIDGKVLALDSSPLPGSRVSVEGRNEIAITDGSGSFVLDVSQDDIVNNTVRLIVETDNVRKPVLISDVQGGAEDNSLNVQIKIDPSDQSIEVSNVTVKAKIVGLCDFYFENFSTIRQSNKVPDKLDCTLKVSIGGDGVPLSDVPFIMQYTGCSETREWTTLAAGETRSAPIAGVGQLEFPFADNDKTCVYRVLAPYGLNHVEPVEVKINTFSKQAYDDRS